MGNFRSVDVPKVLTGAAEVPIPEVMDVLIANSTNYGKENVPLKVEMKFPQIAKTHHVELPHFAELVDILYLQDGNAGPKNSFTNPFDTNTTGEAVPIFSHALLSDCEANLVPARDTEDLKLYFSSPFVGNKKWVQFFGPGTRFGEVEDKDDFKVYLGGFCDPTKAKSFKSRHFSDQEPEAEQVKKISQYQIAVVWIVGDGEEQEKAAEQLNQTHETDDEGGRATEADPIDKGCKDDEVDKKKNNNGIALGASENGVESPVKEKEKKKRAKLDPPKDGECDPEKDATCDKTKECDDLKAAERNKEKQQCDKEKQQCDKEKQQCDKVAVGVECDKEKQQCDKEKQQCDKVAVGVECDKEKQPCEKQNVDCHKAAVECDKVDGCSKDTKKVDDHHHHKEGEKDHGEEHEGEAIEKKKKKKRRPKSTEEAPASSEALVVGDDEAQPPMLDAGAQKDAK